MTPEELAAVDQWCAETLKDYERGRPLGTTVCTYTNMLPTHSIRSQMQTLANTVRARDETIRQLTDALASLDTENGQHYVIFTEDRWTVEHPVSCRLSGQMHECEYHAAVVNVADDGPPDADMLGRWLITDIDEGLPSLELAQVREGAV